MISNSNKCSLLTDIGFAFKPEDFANIPGQPRNNVSLCKVKASSVFLLGGSDSESGEPLNTCMSFSFEHKSWKAEPSMVTRRNLCSSCHLGSYIYVFGGVGLDGPLSSIEKLKI